MSKQEVLVDTVFFHKLSNEGKNLEDFKAVLDKLEYRPVVHPYIADCEMSMFGYFEKLRSEGYIRVAEYSEFLQDDVDKTMYSLQFKDVHDKMRQALEKKGGKKQLDELVIPPNQTIFTMRKSQISLGDVHMILMAFYTKIPIILTDDSDLELLRGLVHSHFDSDTYNLEILDTADVLMKIAILEETTLSKAKLVEILKRVGGRARKSELNTLWNENHSE